MKLYYFSEVLNFDDTIHHWFWSHYFDLPFEENLNELFVGVGTLLNNLLPDNYNRIHKMGFGAEYGNYIPLCQKKWQVHCVRGPLTADAIEVCRKFGIADPAFCSTN